MTNLTVSVITVCYNSESTIIDTIRSVLSQRNIQLEYIIIDGASTDNTPEILKDYEHAIHRIVSEPDLGIYDAMNKGIKLAKGDIIALLNSDDLYAHEDVLYKVQSVFDANPDIDIVYGDLIYIDPKNTSKHIRFWKSSEYYPGFFEDGYVPPHPALFVRKKVYEKAGYFNLDYKFAADYEFMYRILSNFSFKSYYLSEVLVYMRLGGTTNKNLRNIIRGNREIGFIIKKNRKFIPLTFWYNRYIKKIKQYRRGAS